MVRFIDLLLMEFSSEVSALGSPSEPQWHRRKAW
jgi:hypothetical protein